MASWLPIVLLSLCTGSTTALWLRPNFCKRPDPWSIKDIRPEFHVHTRFNTRHVSIQNETELVEMVQNLEMEQFFSVDRQVVFLVHGYLGWMPWTKWIDDMKDALLKTTDSTVIMVSWARGADVFYSYAEAASNTQTVAEVMAQLSRAILNSVTFQGDTEKLYLHCIGHSLGSHVCGQAGRKAGIFDRATGLDPAGPGFDECPHDNLHINMDSADCVDNIHTDGSDQGHWLPFIPNFGTLQSWGHVDFYPNGGGNQPGCWTNDVPPCSHSAAIRFFRYTLENGPDVCTARGTCNDTSAIPGGCTDTFTQPLGYYSSCHRDHKNVIPGNFYLSTEKKNPYC